MIVIEAHGKQGGIPKVVERWGEPDSSKCVLAASINDRKIDPVRVGCYELFEFYGKMNFRCAFCWPLY
jgi:hypothetical protein